ncbi:hypothetical protein COUCH_24355 [Couchioplanes caeruleus]|uniref:hypothetical protein n=1 Tax=Couchioplanes caeruleus TaxID=56438 RepID=UPI0020BF76E7|nr:hypothetical protein [Couchioplanes caeruleus]UQU62166.1 hypothetical protein COUCH_24355 [Couchioplanes caeruleus]
MAGSFSFPSSDEIATWLRQCGLPGGAPTAEKIRRSVRRTSYAFTTSALIPGVLGIALAAAVGRISGRNFWILYLATTALVAAALLTSRELAARFSPRSAVTYYACAALDRLSRAGPLGTSDRRYLSIVLYALESAILSPRLFQDHAGTSEARAFIRRSQVALAKRIGVAETSSLRKERRGAPGPDDLKDAIGNALVAVQANLIVHLEDPGATSIASGQAGVRPPGWLSLMVNKAQEKTAELVVVTAAAALLPWILKING